MLPENENMVNYSLAITVIVIVTKVTVTNAAIVTVTKGAKAIGVKAATKEDPTVAPVTKAAPITKAAIVANATADMDIEEYSTVTNITEDRTITVATKYNYQLFSNLRFKKARPRIEIYYTREILRTLY